MVYLPLCGLFEAPRLERKLSPLSENFDDKLLVAMAGLGKDERIAIVILGAEQVDGVLDLMAG